MDGDVNVIHRVAMMVHDKQTHNFKYFEVSLTDTDGSSSGPTVELKNLHRPLSATNEVKDCD